MDWTRGHIIGHGSTAAVSVAMSCYSGEIFAVKSAELSRSKFLEKEQKILSTLSSAYVVDYKGYDVTREHNKLMFNLMMEYMPDGTLTDEIRKQGGRLDEKLIGYYTKQIVQGLKYLHSKHIVHCDIKGHNILLGKTGAKIGDFGCSKRVDGVTIGGTPMFMAPEVARGEEQGLRADIWALGCTIIEMATGSSPWTNVSNPISLLYHIAFSDQTPEIPKFLSSQARDFLSKCLRRDPKQRWSAKQLLNHPFLDFNTSSPTSILDQCIWNTEEESEDIDDSTREISRLMDLPLQRVRKLELQSRKPDWELDERCWTTVRKKSEDLSACKNGMTAFSTSNEMEVERCNCQDSIFCCSSCSVITTFNFVTHKRGSSNKIMCS